MVIPAGAQVFITGLEGFTGRYLAAQLRRRDVRVSGIGLHGDPAQGVYAIDLRNQPALDRLMAELQPDHVVHLAARAFVDDRDLAEVYGVNIAGTRNLLHALAHAPRPPSQVILASSGAVYGNAPGMLDESAPLNPGNDYAISKMAMEHVARLWSDRLPITLARPFNYTGVGQDAKYVIPKIIAHFRRRAPRIELGNLDVWRDYSDVRAVTDAYIGLLGAGQPYRAVNICSGQETSLREIIDICEHLSGHQIEVAVNPAFVRANEVVRLCGDNRLLRQILPGWTPIALEQTLRWMLEAV